MIIKWESKKVYVKRFQHIRDDHMMKMTWSGYDMHLLYLFIDGKYPNIV